MSENDDNDNDKENNGVNEGKEAEVEEKVQENNGVKEIKETEAEEKDQENNGVTEGEEKSKESEVKRSAASYKDNSDVVLREDLKVVFEKFGDVKVNLFLPPSLAFSTLFLLFNICLRLYCYLLLFFSCSDGNLDIR